MNSTMRASVILIVCVLATGLCTDAEAQLGVEWLARYDGPANLHDAGHALVIDDNSNIYVVGRSEGGGTSEDIVTIKYSPNGSEVWTYRFDGSGSGFDIPTGLAVDDNCCVYVTGKTIDEGHPDGYGTIIGYSLIGDTVWVRHFESLWPSVVAVDGANVYVGGVGGTVKYNSGGDTLWFREWDYGSVSDLAFDDSGHVYVTGADPLFPPVGATAKYSAAGNMLWLNERSSQNVALGLDSSGAVYVGGGSTVTKYSSSGDTLWSGPESGLQLSALAIDANANVWVTGRDGYPDWHWRTTGLTSVGDTIWSRTYEGLTPEDDYPQAIAVDADGHVWVAGPSDYDEGAIVKYSPTGDLLWVRRNSNGAWHSIALDDSANAYVTGATAAPGAFNDMVTIKYSTPTGDVNCDGIIDLVDVVLLGNYLDGLIDLTGTCGGGQSDVDLDGDVDEDDYTLLFDNLDHDEDGIANGVDNCPAIYNPEQETTIHLPGDANQDDVITSADIIHDVNYVFKGGATPLPCEASGDVTCDGVVNSSDLITLVNHVFKSGSPPCEVCEEYGLGWTCP